MVALFLALAKSIYYALSARANKIFQKQTVFVFTESQSRDQLMQKAYSNTKLFIEAAEEDTNSNSSAAFVSLSLYAQILKGGAEGMHPKSRLLEISCFSNLAIFS